MSRPIVGEVENETLSEETLAIMDRANKQYGELSARPENSFTAQEWADRFNISKPTAQRRLNELIKVGIADAVIIRKIKYHWLLEKED